jgi:hypothetical protein
MSPTQQTPQEPIYRVTLTEAEYKTLRRIENFLWHAEAGDEMRHCVELIVSRAQAVSPSTASASPPASATTPTMIMKTFDMLTRLETALYALSTAHHADSALKGRAVNYLQQVIEDIKANGGMSPAPAGHLRVTDLDRSTLEWLSNALANAGVSGASFEHLQELRARLHKALSGAVATSTRDTRPRLTTEDLRALATHYTDLALVSLRAGDAEKSLSHSATAHNWITALEQAHKGT